MKRITIHIALLFIMVPMTMCATTMVDSIFVKGNKAYISGDYATAASFYLQLADSGQTDPDLYYNLGNVYFRQNEYGKARLWYERTLKANPKHQDAAYNIDIVKSLLVDQVKSKPALGFNQWWQQLSTVTDVGHWLLWSIIGLFIICLWVAVLISSVRQGVRILSFIMSIVFTMGFISVMSLGHTVHSIEQSHDQAIVINPSVNVYSTPSENSVQLFVIHEGLKVDIVRSNTSWIEIAMPDGQEGWIGLDDIEAI